MEEISCALIIRRKSLESNNLHQIRKLLAGQLWVRTRHFDKSHTLMQHKSSSTPSNKPRPNRDLCCVISITELAKAGVFRDPSFQRGQAKLLGPGSHYRDRLACEIGPDDEGASIVLEVSVRWPLTLYDGKLSLLARAVACTVTWKYVPRRFEFHPSGIGSCFARSPGASLCRKLLLPLGVTTPACYRCHKVRYPDSRRPWSWASHAYMAYTDPRFCGYEPRNRDRMSHRGLDEVKSRRTLGCDA